VASEQTTTVQGSAVSYEVSRIAVWVSASALGTALAAAGFLLFGQRSTLSPGFLPDGFGTMWNKPPMAMHIGSDVIIWMAYLSIAVTLAIPVSRERSRLPFGWMLLSFGIFLIAAGGVTHLLDIFILWKHWYWLFGYLKLIAAAATVLTAATLPFVVARLRRMLMAADRSKENEQRFLTAAESSMDAFYILESVRDDAGAIVDFRFVYLNENGARLTAFNRDQLLGGLLCEMIPTQRTGEFFAEYRRVAESGESLNREFVLAGDETGARWLSMKAVKLGDGVAVTSSDITARKKIEQELLATAAAARQAEMDERSLSNRMQLANDVAEVGVFEWNLATDALYWDSTMARLYGNEMDAPMTFAQWMEAIHLSDRTDVEMILRSVVVEGRPTTLEFRILRPNGSMRYISSSIGAVHDESGAVTRIVGVNMDITERKLSTARISHLAHHDALTGLPNRELLQDRLQVCVERSKRFQTKLAVLMIDIDCFKKTNDALGHRAGDEVLKVAAARLKAQFRAVDTIARIGGDEFVALLPDLQSAGDAEGLGLKALFALNEPMSIMGQDVRITASIGVAIYPEEALDPDLLLHYADTAMYSVKSSGRNNLQVYNQAMDELTTRRNRMEEALRQAIRHEEFELVYQPQVSLTGAAVTGVEALIRWHSPVLGTVMPLDFISLAEETGLIIPIGEWVLRTACRDAVTIQRMLGRPITMAVNLSPRQFQQENLSETIDRVLTETGLHPDLLELEITENMLVGDSTGALAILDRIRGLGVRLSIDDFGTGFSSMSYIIKFAVDRLKIDRSFVNGSTNDSSCRTVTRAIIGLAHDLKIDVVAEGVETEEQRRFLLRQGCNDAQGYLFSRPCKLDELPLAFAKIDGMRQPAHDQYFSGVLTASTPS
jgi:diguanylate cyclase (GGDEF)-like protein/PAS domain S-box-containing protein